MFLTDTQKEWIEQIKEEIKKLPFRVIFKVKECQNKLYTIFHFYSDDNPDLEKAGDMGFSYDLESKDDLKVTLDVLKKGTE